MALIRRIRQRHIEKALEFYENKISYMATALERACQQMKGWEYESKR